MEKSKFDAINWFKDKEERAVKELCVVVFGRETLATHSLTGRASNAHQGKQAKPALEEAKVADIMGKCDSVVV